MSEQGLYVLSPNPVYDVMGEGTQVINYLCVCPTLYNSL